MRPIAILILPLALGLFATAAVADDRSDIEAETLAHLEASNTALDAASAAIDGGNIADSCPHLRTAGDELGGAYESLGKYREVILQDSELTSSERDTQVGELNELQEQIQQQSDDIDGLLDQYCI
ncbi:hypothetical protein ABAC460_01480 [Asticcacaulis sp. AC460]|uniref:hypothetical protein n=1 Tax=Asticcacaulis sp. AC460 TaxID=1282360 RepID=UPI0003C3F1C5|nr:hypothetical protein [Asticcacaulis sp. AC460]ESQ92947.1 hypothetical protein ABAC460_01480 [Asticcacaulis sp. AC460]